jgi:hypothetical protein
MTFDELPKSFAIARPRAFDDRLLGPFHPAAG